MKPIKKQQKKFLQEIQFRKTSKRETLEANQVICSGYGQLNKMRNKAAVGNHVFRNNNFTF